MAREQFFKRWLVESGTLVELFLYQAYDKHFKKHNTSFRRFRRPKWSARMGTMLWEHLHVVCWYAMVNKTPMDALVPVAQELHIYQTLLKQWLVELNRSGIRVQMSDFEHGELQVSRLAAQLEPVVERLYAHLKHNSKTFRHPISKTLARWRTFARNYQPKKTISSFGLPTECVKDAKSLASNVGAQQVMRLWDEMFSQPQESEPSSLIVSVLPLPDAQPEATLKPVQDTESPESIDKFLPPFIRVQSLSNGMLEVTALFTPRISIPMSPEAKQTLPPSLKKRLAPISTSVICVYRELEKAVQSLVPWFKEQGSLIAELDADYLKWQEAMKRKSVMDRLSKTFSEEEITLLSELLLERQAAATSPA
jgi:hypothetical protein